MLRFVLTLSASLLLVLGTNPASADPELHRQMVAEPESLDPQKVSGQPEAVVLEDLFEGLLAASATGEPLPGAASSWDTTADGLVWTFHLRTDGKWSDGDPLTAEDFVYSLRREVDPATASPYSAALSPIAGADEIVAGHAPPASLGVAAVDAQTLKITLARPTPWLLALLAHHAMYPVPRKAIEAFGDKWTRPGNMVSNGPYAMAGWVPHGEITIARNPNFHDAAAVKIAIVHHILADDPTAAFRRYAAGELDNVTIPGREVDKAKIDYPDQLHLNPVLSTTFLAIDLNRGEFADVRIRRALSMVLDRDTLVKRVLKGAQLPAVGLIPPGGIPGYEPPQPDWAGQPLPARIETARQLMAAARGVDAPPLRLTVRTVKSEQAELIVSAIVSMWKSALGIDATLDTSEWSVLEQDLHHDNYQLAFYGWAADYVDPWTYLANYRSDAAQLNISNYRNPSYDALLDQSRQAADSNARMKLLEQAEAMLLSDQILIPIDFGVTQTLVNPHLAGWSASPINMHPSRYLSWTD
ncbi:MAG TPA: peptide ABC transporter substrate-binding protein [Aliidongia sp.]|nr:peptide ABC transporter substrate-binding protein [Aliidongia sp.]